MFRGVDGIARHIDAGQDARRSCDRHRVVTLPFLDTDDTRIRCDFRHERFDQSDDHPYPPPRRARVEIATRVPAPRLTLSTPRSTNSSCAVYKVHGATR